MIDRLLGLAVQIQPEYCEAYHELGEAYRNYGQIDQAQYAYQQAITIEPRLAKAFIGLAEVHKQRGESPGVVRALQSAIQADASSVRCHFNPALFWGLVAENKETKDLYLDILVAYHRIVAQDPRCAELRYNMGRVLAIKHDNLEPAVVEYQQAIQLKPNYPEAYMAMGNAYLDLNQARQALTAFQQAASIDWSGDEWYDAPYKLISKGSAYLGLAKAHVRLGQFDQAMVMARLAIEMVIEMIPPDDGISYYGETPEGMLAELAEAYDDQGHAYLEEKRYDWAVKAFRNAVDALSRTADAFGAEQSYLKLAIAYYHLGVQNLNNGKDTEARKLLSNALDAWEMGYSILRNAGGEVPEIWRNVRAAIDLRQRQ